MSRLLVVAREKTSTRKRERARDIDSEEETERDRFRSRERARDARSHGWLTLGLVLLEASQPDRREKNCIH